MSKFKKYGLLAIIILTAIAFLAAGVAKLMGIEMVHQSFSTLGLPFVFGYFIGACEVLGAIALFIRSLSSIAALGLSIIMVGASYYHIQFDPQGLIAAVVLFVFSVVIFFARKDESVAFGKNELENSPA